jgi:hypothetical protein
VVGDERSVGSGKRLRARASVATLKMPQSPSWSKHSPVDHVGAVQSRHDDVELGRVDARQQAGGHVDQLQELLVLRPRRFADVESPSAASSRQPPWAK